MKRLTRLNVVCALAVLCSAASVRAGGFDTPILYTARHMGMGGTAIGYVNDASAFFHNPAGLQGVKGLSLIADFSLIIAKVKSSPDIILDEPINVEAEPLIAPFFLAGAAYRVHEWITLGFALYPSASGGAEYRYENIAGNAVRDETSLVFLEVTAGASINVPKDLLIPGELSIGAGYRINYLKFGRKKGPLGDPSILDLDLDGWDFTGFRVGAQWRLNEYFSMGIVYRHHIDVKAEADSATAMTQDVEDVSLVFELPSKLGAGVRGDYGPFGLSFDFEYGFYSQNDIHPLKGTIQGADAEIPNIYEWENAITLRAGFEYRQALPVGKLPLRVGYIFDGKVGNKSYPTAFGTPPVETHSITAGIGYIGRIWEVNLAYARRFGSVTITQEDLDKADKTCSFCSKQGDYNVGVNGVYVDVSVDFDI